MTGASVDVVEEILGRLEASGAKIELQLAVEYPDDALSDDILREIRDLKPLIVSRLSREMVWSMLKDERWGGATMDDANIVIDRP
jgi:hypothetical protein